MNFKSNEIGRSTMKSIIALLTATMGCMGAAGLAQSAPASNSVETVEFFHLMNSDPTEPFEIVDELHSLLDSKTTVKLNREQNTLLVKGTTDQLTLVRKLVDELDRPKRTYRIAYTITEFDSGKRIGVQHFAMVVVSGQRTTLKQGSKVPVATGTYTAGSASAQTQFTYLDVGINLDATVEESPNGVRLRSKEEQSSIADSSVIADVREPIIRQSVLEGTSIISLGKPLILGSLDVPGSTRHLDIEAVVEVVK